MILQYLANKLASVLAAGKDIIDGLIINDSVGVDYQVSYIDISVRDDVENQIAELRQQGHKIALLACESNVAATYGFEKIRRAVGYPTSYAVVMEGVRIEKDDSDWIDDPKSFVCTTYYAEVSSVTQEEKEKPARILSLIS